jgi:hypothetical protein
MNVGIGNEAAQFHCLEYFVSNFRYSVFAMEFLRAWSWRSK